MHLICFGFLFIFYQVKAFSFQVAEIQPKGMPNFPTLVNQKEKEIKESEDYPFVMNDVQEDFQQAKEFDIFLYQADSDIFYTKYKRYNPNGIKIKDRVNINFKTNMQKMDAYTSSATNTYRTRIMAPTTLANGSSTSADNEGVEYYQHLVNPAKYKEDIEVAVFKNAQSITDIEETPYQKQKRLKEQGVLIKKQNE
jgi:hypothetical protein